MSQLTGKLQTKDKITKRMISKPIQFRQIDIISNTSNLQSTQLTSYKVMKIKLNKRKKALNQGNIPMSITNTIVNNNDLMMNIGLNYHHNNSEASQVEFSINKESNNNDLQSYYQPNKKVKVITQQLTNQRLSIQQTKGKSCKKFNLNSNFNQNPLPSLTKLIYNNNNNNEDYSNIQLPKIRNIMKNQPPTLIALEPKLDTRFTNVINENFKYKINIKKKKNLY